MLGSVLGYFQRGVGDVHDALLNAIDLIPENKSIFVVRLRMKILQLHCLFGLLHTDDSVSFAAQSCDKLKSVIRVFPGYAVLCAQGGFVDFGSRGAGADSAQPYLVDLEGIGGAEGTSDVVGAAYVVKNKDNSGGG